MELPKIKKIEPDQIKRMAIFFCVALFLLVILLRYLFLIPKVLANRSYEKNLRVLIKNQVTRIGDTSKISKEKLEKELDLLNKRFPKKEEIPSVLDELEQLVKKSGVEITSLTEQGLGAPAEVEVKGLGGPYKFSYQPLAITMGLSCPYINLANFLEALDNWLRGVVIVRSFSIEKDEGITEKLKVNGLVINVAIIGDGNK